MELILGSGNRGKLRELQSVAERFGVSVRSIADLTERYGTLPVVGEGGISYEENSRTKAIVYSRWAHQGVLADDTGIEFPALYGFPGVYTADVGLPRVVDALGALREVEANFVTVVTYAEPTGRLVSARGELKGVFRVPRKGSKDDATNPLPFAPHFYPLGRDVSLQVLTSEASTNRDFLGHRGIAFARILRALT